MAYHRNTYYVINLILGKSEYNSTELNDFEHDLANGVLTVQCKDSFKQDYDSYQIIIDFENTFGNDMSGFYRSSYTGTDGKKRFNQNFNFSINFNTLVNELIYFRSKKFFYFI